MKLRGIKMYFKLFQIGGSIIAWPNVCRERRLFSPRRRSSPSRPPVHRSRWRFSRPPPLSGATRARWCARATGSACAASATASRSGRTAARPTRSATAAPTASATTTRATTSTTSCAEVRCRATSPSVRREGGGFFGLPVVGFRVGAIWKKIHIQNSTRPWGGEGGGGGGGGSSSVYQLLIFM